MELSTRYNYYDILEVGPHTPQHEITTAYERARVTYSGENPAIYSMFSEVEAREILQMIEEAYSVLGNKTLRAIYDEKIVQSRKSVDLSFEAIKAESKLISVELPKKPAPKTPAPSVPRDMNFENEYLNWSDWDGEKLQRVREYKHISYERMSEITRISAYYLNALEKMEPDKLPAVVFVRGYIIQMARTLGLPEKVVVDSYIQKFKSHLGKAQ